MINEVIMFTYGDASKPATWSNVPYCFCKSLEDKGILVRNINIDQDKATPIWCRIMRRLTLLFYPDSKYQYIRTKHFQKKTYKKIKQAVNRYPDADWCIFLNFDFYNKFSKARTMVFGDWTYKTLIEERLNRKPYFFEKYFERVQKNVITSADKVVCMFPRAAESIRRDYNRADIIHFGCNVVNNLYEFPLFENDIIDKKNKSNDIIFIGGKKYLSAALQLLKAVEIFHAENPSIACHFIGLTLDELGIAENDDKIKYIYCYGYLDKNSSKDKAVYYGTLMNAKVFCNPTQVWGGYSSTIEAMFFYTPVIVSPYQDFVEEFGQDIDFGRYCNSLTPSEILFNLKSVFYDTNYKQICISAHSRVEEYTWDNYATKIIANLDAT